MLSATRCSSLFPDGELHFNENKNEPPSRAYLKLWEFFTLHGKSPGPGEKVLDLGSSPGGWTWVLDQLGADVLSIDKAPLSPAMKVSKRVEYRSESAFALDPKTLGNVDWLFSDVICYPERLLELIHAWKDTARNMVCTIKFQGPTNHKIIDEFLKVPGSLVQHLSANKHELTWSRLSPA
jgi:23S rRNA (cytidine2498-2'-O)-methyltransferase